MNHSKNFHFIWQQKTDRKISIMENRYEYILRAKVKTFLCFYNSVCSATLANGWQNYRPFLYVRFSNGIPPTGLNRHQKPTRICWEPRLVQYIAIGKLQRTCAWTVCSKYRNNFESLSEIERWKTNCINFVCGPFTYRSRNTYTI